MSDQITPAIDLRNETQVAEYFANLERDYPELMRSIRTLGLTYQQYLAAVQAIQAQSYVSTISSRIRL